MHKLLLLVLACLVIAVPASAVVVEDFEDGDISNYTATGAGSVSAGATAAAAHDGNYGLQMDGLSAGEDWIYRNDAEVYNEQGDVISCWARYSAVAGNQRNYFGFGATAAGCYSIVMGPNTSTFLLYLDAGYGYTSLASAPQTWTPNKWYRLEADWGIGGNITANLYDSDGVTLLNSVSAFNNTFTSGGIAFRYFDTGTSGHFDTVSVGGFSPVESTTWGAIKSMYR